jgi:hypothetical protein
MAVTTKEEITSLLERGKSVGATHVIVVWDKGEMTNYPVFVLPHENAREKAGRYNDESNEVMEVYSLSRDWEVQLNEQRAFNCD